MAATYRNCSTYLPARRATVWVGSVCLWPGQVVTVREPLPETHPAIVRGVLRRIDGHAEAPSAPPAAPANAPGRNELWAQVKRSTGGAAAYTEATGRTYRSSTAEDLLRYLGGV